MKTNTVLLDLEKYNNLVSSFNKFAALRNDPKKFEVVEYSSKSGIVTVTIFNTVDAKEIIDKELRKNIDILEDKIQDSEKELDILEDKIQDLERELDILKNKPKWYQKLLKL